ncbi:hypothetical protein BDR22DRAFT_134638 [Usnea florida]
MAYFTSNSNERENGFEYPDPESIFDVQSDHQTPMAGYSASSRQNCYPSPSNQAVFQARNSIAEHSRQSSSSDPWQDVPSLAQVNAVLPYASSPPPSLGSALQETKKGKRESVPYPAARQQAPRGTTGKIVCTDCGGKFTVMSSLNRHSKICRGRKKAWQPASTPHRNMMVPNADSASDLSVHATAADEHDDVSSEGVSSITGINPYVYHTPTKRTRSTSHDTEDSILADKLSNYSSLTAGSNWSPPARPDQTEGPDSNFHTTPATKTSFSFSNSQNTSPTSGLSPYSQRACEAPSYVPHSGDTPANNNPFFCDVCYGTFSSRDLLQIHRASAHGVTEDPELFR